MNATESPARPRRRRWALPLLAFAAAAFGLSHAPAAAQPCGSGNWAPLPDVQPRPSPRGGAAIAYDAGRRRIVLFGGFAASQFVNDTWEYDITTNVWTNRTPPVSPSARTHAMMVYDTARGKVVLFGGANVNFQSDTWEWDGPSGTWEQRAAFGPAGRNRHALTFDSARARVLLFGGYGISVPGNQLADTWEFEPFSGAWTRLTPGVSPAARWGHTMEFDPSRGRAVLFGGSTGAGETWEYDPAAAGGAGNWIQRTPTLAPPARRYHATAFDTVRNRIILFGGTPDDSGVLSDTWEWNPASGSMGAWLQRTTPTTPPGRFLHSMVFENDTGRALMFGGFGAGPYRNDAWAYTTPVAPAILVQPVGRDVLPGQMAALHVVAAGQQLAYEWRREGDVVGDGPDFLGATTPTLVVRSFSPALAGRYEVHVSSPCGVRRSIEARLVAACPADFNGDGAINVQDFLAFLSAFSAGCP